MYKHKIVNGVINVYFYGERCDCEANKYLVTLNFQLYFYFFSGERCDRCANNYFGKPTIPNQECTKCDCNRNIDETVPGNCNPDNGECLKCLYNTAGLHCEDCMDGFYGDASRQECLSMLILANLFLN